MRRACRSLATAVARRGTREAEALRRSLTAFRLSHAGTDHTPTTDAAAYAHDVRSATDASRSAVTSLDNGLGAKARPATPCVDAKPKPHTTKLAPDSTRARDAQRRYMPPRHASSSAFAASSLVGPAGLGPASHTRSKHKRCRAIDTPTPTIIAPHIAANAAGPPDSVSFCQSEIVVATVKQHTSHAATRPV